MYNTYRFRIKDSTSSKYLNKISCNVNFVWNYCNETSYNRIKSGYKKLTCFELQKLTNNCSKELKLSSTTIQKICEIYVLKRDYYGKQKLKWRKNNKSLGWIPIGVRGFQVYEDNIFYQKQKFRFWKSQDICGQIKTANFSQDTKGNWYINIQCKVNQIFIEKTGKYIGIDMGVKTIATGSNGTKFNRENLTTRYEDKLSKCQRAGKKKLMKSIYLKIKNSRLDWAQKNTTEIINNFDLIIVGNACSSKLIRTPLAKSISDAGWYQFKSLLAYKAIRFGKEYREVNETFSTVTCSTCLNKTGPSGLSALGVREWTCSICGTHHDRDVNAAENILRFGHESPKGIPFIRKDANTFEAGSKFINHNQWQ